MITKKLELSCDTKLTVTYPESFSLERKLSAIAEVEISDPCLWGTLVVPDQGIAAIRSLNPRIVDDGILIPCMKLRLLGKSLKPLRNFFTELITEIEAEAPK